MNVVLTIKGTNVVPSSLRARTLRSDWPLSARQTLSFDLFGPAVRPEISDDVVLTVDGTATFGGIVFDADQEDRGDDRDVVCRIRAGNYAVLADGPMLNGIFPEQTLKQRLQTIRDRQLILIGVTVNPAQPDGPILPETAYPWKKLSEVLTDLSTQSGYFWEINPAKQLGMFPGGSRAAPFALSDADGSLIANGLSLRKSRSQYVNRVWILFGSGGATEITYKTVGNGTREYTVPYFVATTISQVFVDGVLHVVGTYPDAAWTWTFDPARNMLVQRSDQPILGAANVIETAPFAANWPGAVYADNPEAATQESSVKFDYPDVFDYETAKSLAVGALRKLEGLPRTFTALTYRFGLQPGMTVPVTCALYGLAAKPCLITNVQIQHVGTQRSNAEPWLLSRVELVEGNESKGNWIQFWDQAMKSGGGSNASVAGGSVIPPAAPLYFVASLGGSTTTGATGSAYQAVPDAQYIKLPSGVALVADVRFMSRYGGTPNAYVRIWDETSGAMVVEAANVPASTWTKRSLPFNAVTDHSYVLQVHGSDSGSDVLATGNVHPL